MQYKEYIKKENENESMRTTPTAQLTQALCFMLAWVQPISTNGIIPMIANKKCPARDDYNDDCDAK
jgi:hypothetical protein